MTTQQSLVLLALGALAWLLGTLFFAWRGQALLESTRLRFALGLCMTPVLSALLCVVTLRYLLIAPVSWASATVLLALPGMMGEALVLSRLPTFMPKWQAASGGRYGALLFATYALVLAIAEWQTLRASASS